MKVLNKLFSGGASKLVESVGGVLDNFNSIDEFCTKCEIGSLVDEKCDCCPPVPSTDGVMQGPKDKEDYLDAIGLGPNTYRPEKPLKDFPIKPLQERLQKLAGIKPDRKK